MLEESSGRVSTKNIKKTCKLCLDETANDVLIKNGSLPLHDPNHIVVKLLM